MTGLAVIQPGATVRRCNGIFVGRIEGVKNGQIRLKDIPEWDPRSPYISMAEIESIEQGDIYLKRTPPD